MLKKRLVILSTAALFGTAGLAGCGAAEEDTTPLANGSAAVGTTATPDASAQPGGAAPAAGQARGGGAPPGLTEVTGATAEKASAAALAEYPGAAERVAQLDDGSFIVHVVTDTGEQRVAVSEAYAVTGLDAGGPPPGGQAAPPAGAAAPAATDPS